MLYAILSKLPKPLDIESLIQRTIELLNQHPPERLPYYAWRRVSKYSVLKTTRDLSKGDAQTLADGEQWLQQQAAEIERAERRRALISRANEISRHYRRPAGALTLAIMIGMLSVWVGGRSPSDMRVELISISTTIQRHIQDGVRYLLGLRQW